MLRVPSEEGGRRGGHAMGDIFAAGDQSPPHRASPTQEPVALSLDGSIDDAPEESPAELAAQCLDFLLTLAPQLDHEGMKLVGAQHPFATPGWISGLSALAETKASLASQPAIAGCAMNQALGLPSTKEILRVGEELTELPFPDSSDIRQSFNNLFVSSRQQLTTKSAKLVLVMVGLPARGKSMVSYKLSQFMSWRGWNAKAFSAGATRREVQRSPTGGGGSAFGKKKAGADAARPASAPKRPAQSAASFFDSGSAVASAVREEIATAVLGEVFTWLDGSGEVAIFDATNSSRARRDKLRSQIGEHAAASGQPINVVFVECICSDPAVLRANMLTKVHASPDFYGMDDTAALADLAQRIEYYEQSYESVHEAEGAYIKIYDLSSKVAAHNVFGRMARSVTPLILALHFVPRSVALVSVPTAEGEAGDLGRGNSPVQRRGRLGGGGAGSATAPAAPAVATFAGRVAAWAASRNWSCNSPDGLVTFCSTHASAMHVTQAVATATGGAAPRALTILHGMSTEATEPRPFKQRPDGGESYYDVVRRLESAVIELEAHVSPLLIVAHPATCRALRAYFLNLPLEGCMHAGSSAGADALSEGAPQLLQLSPQLDKLGFTETVVDLGAFDPVDVA